MDSAADVPVELPPVTAQPETTLPVAGDTPAPAALSAIEAAEDQADVTPTAPWEFPRQRPGAMHEEATLPTMLAPPACVNARLCAGEDR